ncbi:MAG: hypothetical protein AAGA56_23130 [Myxococcota bacterium]
MRLFVSLATIALVGCTDPLLDRRIEELGVEEVGFPPSAIHRRGQPCVRCHSDYEGANPEMSIGGTLFVTPEPGDPTLLPAAGLTVRIIDSTGQIVDMPTNECGNFFERREDFEPAFPLRAEVWGPSAQNPASLVQIKVMSTRIARDGSCGSCHTEPLSPASPGAIFVDRDAIARTGLSLSSALTCPTPRFGRTLLSGVEGL